MVEVGGVPEDLVLAQAREGDEAAFALDDRRAVLGGGTPAFGAGPVPPLSLTGTRRREDSENRVLRYKVLSPGT